MSEFSEDRVYARHRPRKGAVLIIGTGAVGGFVAEELSRIGISPLWLVDPDVLEIENIVRHPLGAQDVGQPKASSLAAQIRREFPRCDVVGVDNDFLTISRAEQLRLVNGANVVVAATDNFECQQRVNRVCLEAEKPVVFPSVWVDPDNVRDAEVGEIQWVMPGLHTPCYECAFAFRQGEADAQAARGTRIDIQLLALTTAQVVAAIADPSDDRSAILINRDEQRRRRTCIYVHGFAPTSAAAARVFPGPGLRNRFVYIPFPPIPCPGCGESEPAANIPTLRPVPPPLPSPQPVGPQTIRSQLVPSAAPALIVSAILAVICFVSIVILVDKQRAEVGNPTNGLPANNSPYALYGFFVGIVGFAIIIAIIDYWVINPEHDLDWGLVGGLTLMFAVILGILIAIFAKHQSQLGSAPNAPPPVTSSSPSIAELKCDPDIGGSVCQEGGNGDTLALDIFGVPNIYDLCNSGYSLDFTDNRGNNLDDISGIACLTTAGVDAFMPSDNGSGVPYVSLDLPINSNGTKLCGQWAIMLRIEDPSSAVLYTASYRMTVKC